MLEHTFIAVFAFPPRCTATDIRPLIVCACSVILTRFFNGAFIYIWNVLNTIMNNKHLALICWTKHYITLFHIVTNHHHNVGLAIQSYRYKYTTHHYYDTFHCSDRGHFLCIRWYLMLERLKVKSLKNKHVIDNETTKLLTHWVERNLTDITILSLPTIHTHAFIRAVIVDTSSIILTWVIHIAFIYIYKKKSCQQRELFTVILPVSLI